MTRRPLPLSFYKIARSAGHVAGRNLPARQLYIRVRQRENFFIQTFFFSVPIAQTAKNYWTRARENVNASVIIAPGERAKPCSAGARFPRSSRGQKRFRRSTKQHERPRATRKTTSPRSVRCVMRENLRARQPRGTRVLKEISYGGRRARRWRCITPPFRERIDREIARYLKYRLKKN